MSPVNCSSSIPRRIGVAKSILVLVSLLGMNLATAAPPQAVTDAMPAATPGTNVTVANPDPSRQAFSATFSLNSTAGAVNASFGTIPAGKRLVIENESIVCSVSGVSGGSILYAYLLTNLGRTYLLLQKMGSGGAFNYYAGTFTSTMYADPKGLGTGDITIFVQGSPAYLASTDLNCDGAIVGHTVASPHP
jgi:hypothetical protein